MVLQLMGFYCLTYVKVQAEGMGACSQFLSVDCFLDANVQHQAPVFPPSCSAVLDAVRDVLLYVWGITGSLSAFSPVK